MANLVLVCVFRAIIGLHEEGGQSNGPVYFARLAISVSWPQYTGEQGQYKTEY